MLRRRRVLMIFAAALNAAALGLVGAGTVAASPAAYGFHVSWVAAYKQCGTGGNSPNAEHRPPLAYPSCNPPALVDPNVRGGPQAGEWPLDVDFTSSGACPGGPTVGGPDICI